MENAWEKVISDLEQCIDDSVAAVVPADTVREAIALLNGLGGLINEIWAYARYCADRLNKTQEPVEPKLIGIYYVCGQCGMRTVGQRKAQTNDILKVSNYCPDCGRAVKWQ